MRKSTPITVITLYSITQPWITITSGDVLVEILVNVLVDIQIDVLVEIEITDKGAELSLKLIHHLRKSVIRVL
jgi:hypothetical protein